MGLEIMFTKEQAVARWLREMIVSGRLAPGTPIRQRQIATELGVSETPVREAFQRLVSEGYLTATPHVGVCVSRVNRQDLDEIYSLRQLLEGRLTAACATRASAEVVAQLKDLNRQLGEAFEARNYIEARRINFLFHEVIWDAAEQPMTLEIVNRLWAKFPWDTLAYVDGRDVRVLDEHEKLVAAIESGSRARAEKFAQEHIDSSYRDYIEVTQSSDGQADGDDVVDGGAPLPGRADRARGARAGRARTDEVDTLRKSAS